MTRNLAINCFKSERVMYTCFERETKRNIQKKYRESLSTQSTRNYRTRQWKSTLFRIGNRPFSSTDSYFADKALPCNQPIFNVFYVPAFFFSALIVTKAVLFVQVARHFPIHHDAYPTCVFFFCEKVDQHFQTRPSHCLHYDESRILKI